MYQLPKLSYLLQDLEPFIDIHTMGLHYHKHHQNYLNKLNELLKESNYDYRYKLSELLYHLDEFDESVRDDILYNLSGVLNHNLYWKSINPKPNKPNDKLRNQIEKDFENYKKFWKKFTKKAIALKGAGYTFLVLKKDKHLDIINTSNQDTPLSKGYIPLFTIDMWEHAYYLNNENNKDKYLENFEKIADFTYANEVFECISK